VQSEQLKVIITGGCGFIGSHLVDFWLAQGAEVIVIDNLSTGLRQNLNPLAQLLEIDLQKLSPAEHGAFFEQTDYVFHLGALAAIVPSIQNPVEYIEANVNGTLKLLEICRAYPPRKLIYTASGSCYGIPEVYPTLEDAPIAPEYPYALSKWQGEELVKHWGQVYKLPWISLRLTNVFGPRSRTDTGYGAVFGVFLAQKAHGKPLTIVGDGQQSRDFTYVLDVVQAFYKAAVSDVVGEVINIGSGNHYSINYLAQLLEPVGIVYVPKRPGEPDITFVEIAKAQRLLGYEPQWSFEAGVQEMLNQLEFWQEAPVWEPESIATATEDWFKYLSPQESQHV
jgi:UDP-glucose 4-epimerase